ncbi:MAG: hypothetical protein CSA42_06160 [Gammaproteobacteria bacterium]|nr:MAG: hypothetical protein CSA42_06160 [Gammaproteobacteria bacterium]
MQSLNKMVTICSVNCSAKFVVLSYCKHKKPFFDTVKLTQVDLKNSLTIVSLVNSTHHKQN